MIKDIVRDYERIKKELFKSISDKLGGEFQQIFDRYPDLKSFGWAQYTPYFNDGDECVFGVHCDPDNIYINDELGYDLYEYTDGKRIYPTPWTETASDEIADLISEIPEEILKATYGDHVQVTVKRNGKVTTDDYSHD